MALAIINKPRVFEGVGYHPHEAQKPIHKSKARHRVIDAGRRAGKSEIGGHELTVEVEKTRHMLPLLEANRQRREFWIVGPEYTDSEKEFRKFWGDLEIMGAHVAFDRPGTYNNPEAGEMVVSMWNGKFIVHAKSAKYPSTLVGEGLSGVVLAEAAKLKPSVWSKYLRPTLADFRGWSIWSSTPEGRNHFYESFKRGQDPSQPDWESWKIPAWRNPIVYPGGYDDPEIQDMRREMSEEKFQQEIGAEFTEFVGRVFKDFDEEIHVRDLKFNPDLPLFGACDYGWTNPFVWLVIQIDVWDNIYVLAEYRAERRDINDIAKDLARWPLASHASQFYPDPASPGDTAVLSKALKVSANTSTGGELKWRLELIRQSLKVQPEHLEDGHPDKQPKIFFDRKGCPETIREMQDYRYPDNKSEVRPNKEEPMDVDDHGPEALGRFFRGHFGGPAGPATKGRARVRPARMKR